jgi:Flp pilus assembly protein TadG
MMARSFRPRRPVACPRERGQATVEFALILPLVILMLLAVLQTALVVRDYVGVVHAAREAARAVSVDRNPGAATAAARRVLARADVSVGARPAVGGPIRVEVRYVSHTDLPMVGLLFPDPELHATAVIRTER